MIMPRTLAQKVNDLYQKYLDNCSTEALVKRDYCGKKFTIEPYKKENDAKKYDVPNVIYLNQNTE